MDDFESLSHTRWDCKYHVVFIPKCRRKTLYTELRKHLGEVFRRLAEQKESRVEEGWHNFLGNRLMVDALLHPPAAYDRQHQGALPATPAGMSQDHD
jgi:putative transposase